MLLKHPSLHFQSLSQLKRYSSLNSLHKQQSSKQLDINSSRLCLKTQRSISNLKSKRSKQFIPFCQERDLGRLIPKQSDKKSKRDSVQGLLDIINFRNFKKLYTMQKNYQQAKYASKIRNSGQKDLINHNEWFINDLRQKSTSLLNKKNQLQYLNQPTKQNQITLLRNCCQSTERHLNSSSKNKVSLDKKQTKNYNKIDLQLYKKISVNRPPTQFNHQLNTFYQHYVQACQLNQNQRRLFLTKKAK